LLGTGGAIKKALPLIGEQFFVYNGDTYLPIDFQEVERSFFISNKPALMTVSKNNNQWDKSNVLFLDGRIIEYNKQISKSDMIHIDYGLGILSASVLDNKPDNEPFDLADVYHNLSVTEQLASFEAHGRLYEIGSQKGLEETINMFKKECEI
jgi:NDP-sugar pyrophosphorylase family protein